MMQEYFMNSTNFGQSQWLMKNLSPQRDGVRSDLHLFLIEDSPTIKVDFVLIPI